MFVYRVPVPERIELTCPNCGGIHNCPVEFDADGGYAYIETEFCNAPLCMVKLCDQCPQHVCDGCGNKFCADHEFIEQGDGDKFCVDCDKEANRRERPRRRER
jgi:hypothetical protein